MKLTWNTPKEIKAMALCGKLFVVLPLLAILGIASEAAAQGRKRYPPQHQPAVSPYLNLLRPEGVAPNYHALVRPEIELRRNFYQQSRTVSDLQRGLATQERAGASTTSALTTGHRSYFLNYRGFYPSFSGGGLGSRSRTSR